VFLAYTSLGHIKNRPCQHQVCVEEGTQGYPPSALGGGGREGAAPPDRCSLPWQVNQVLALSARNLWNGVQGMAASHALRQCLPIPLPARCLQLSACSVDLRSSRREGRYSKSQRLTELLEGRRVPVSQRQSQCGPARPVSCCAEPAAAATCIAV
jgi:hypothetical protein